MAAGIAEEAKRQVRSGAAGQAKRLAPSGGNAVAAAAVAEVGPWGSGTASLGMENALGDEGLV